MHVCRHQQLEQLDQSHELRHMIQTVTVYNRSTRQQADSNINNFFYSFCIIVIYDKNKKNSAINGGYNIHLLSVYVVSENNGREVQIHHHDIIFVVRIFFFAMIFFMRTLNLINLSTIISPGLIQW